MTLRDWFATHAPTEIPKWFQWAGQPVPDVPIAGLALQQVNGFDSLSYSQKQTLRAWVRDPAFALEDDIADIGDAAAEIRRQAELTRERILRENDAGRYYAWRWAYADAMLNARKA
jgi:hypothetical protein